MQTPQPMGKPTASQQARIKAHAHLRIQRAALYGALVALQRLWPPRPSCFARNDPLRPGPATWLVHGEKAGGGACLASSAVKHTCFP